MTRTFGPDNAIAWVQVRLRGGPRNLLATTATYAVIIGLVMLGSVQLIPEQPGRVLASWATGMLVLQSAVLLLFGSSRVASAIRQDISTGIIESNRLMPVAASQAVIGYVIGATSQAMCLAVANVALGLVAVIGSGAGAPDLFLVANGMLLAFAAFFWVAIACAAMHPRNVTGLIFILPAAIVVGQGGALGLLPGLTLLITPILGTSIYDRSAGLTMMADAFALSVAAQVVVGALCFAAAARKYRRSDVIGFTPLLGLLLLAAWAGASWAGMMWWEAIRPRMFRTVSVDPEAQALASIILAMVVALVPIWAAGEQYVEWLRRRLQGDPALGRPPVADWVVIGAATLLALPLAAGPGALLRGEWPEARRFAVAGLAILFHLVAASYVRRTLRIHTKQGNGLLLMLIGFWWVGPLLADLIRHEMFDKFNDPVLTEISCLSPVGTLVALADGRAAQVGTGLLIQAGIALLAGLLYHGAHPVRRGRRRRGTLAA